MRAWNKRDVNLYRLSNVMLLQDVDQNRAGKLFDFTGIQHALTLDIEAININIPFRIKHNPIHIRTR